MAGQKRIERKPDFDQFLKVLRRQGRPDHLPFYEHLASPGFIARRTGTEFDQMTWGAPNFWPIYVDFWLGMGYDCIPLEVGPRFKLPASAVHEGAVSLESEARVCIRTMDDFETYPWPDESNVIDFQPFELVAKLLPDGVKIVGGVGGGPYEWATTLMGVVGLATALFDAPDLVTRLFAKLSTYYVSAHHQLASMDCIGALRQGDDLGFKTATFLKPADLRRLIFPIYTRVAEEAHRYKKPFILHSCGNLNRVYDDLIDTCHIDAKHSFEETILPVEDFKRQYGERITPIGGLDVDMICRADEATLRAYARDKIEKCFYDGWWALGTGNSLTNYMPVENYIAVLEEGVRVTA